MPTQVKYLVKNDDDVVVDHRKLDFSSGNPADWTQQVTAGTHRVEDPPGGEKRGNPWKLKIQNGSWVDRAIEDLSAAEEALDRVALVRRLVEVQSLILACDNQWFQDQGINITSLRSSLLEERDSIKNLLGS